MRIIVFTKIFGVSLLILSISALFQILSGLSSGFSNTKIEDIVILIALVGSAIFFTLGKKLGLYFFLILFFADTYFVFTKLSNNYGLKGGEIFVFISLFFFSTLFLIFRNRLNS